MLFPSSIISTGAGCSPSRDGGWPLWLQAGALLAWGVVAQASPGRTTALLTFASFTNFSRTSTNGDILLTSPPRDPGFEWNELIASWNTTTNAKLTVEARAFHQSEATPWFALGKWSAGPEKTARTSVNGQQNAAGRVETDTLKLSQRAGAAQVRLTLHGPPGSLKFLTLCLSDTRTRREPRPPDHAAWGHIVEVPIRSQADYPEGVDQWCSPTSTTMLLAYWAGELHRPELDPDVRVTAAGVFDPGWGGTGNWPFNMAFAGLGRGLRACVARMEDVADLEAWIRHGIPVAASVSYLVLKGATRPEPGDGHIVVVCGFTASGDVVVNDPGVRRERVRRVFLRADFERAWQRSSRTVYLVWPEPRTVPWPVPDAPPGQGD